MTDMIDRNTFDHLVSLAAFELDESQAKYLLREMNNQLKAIQELAAIPLDENMPVTSHGVPYTDQISALPRADEWLPFEHPEDIIAQAPQFENGYIIVPDIPHQTLE
jgi:aspartyl-tRNA(Asn)/glutamyl-tRNA(Gln) amidotransferase subunit C